MRIMGMLLKYSRFACQSRDINFKVIWVKVFRDGPSKICGRQPLKKFTWAVLEYPDPYFL